MSFADRLIHTLVIERATYGSPDDYGQPAQTWATLDTVPGLVMPKAAREVALVSQGGAEIGDHTIFMAPRDITPADRVKLSPDDGRIFELTGVRNLIGHHLEIDARVVV